MSPSARCLVVAAALATVCFAQRAQAQASAGPSFDCAKASAPSERAICASSDLAKLDGSLGQVYAKARAVGTVAKRRMLADEQRGWLKRRDACGDKTDCMRPLMQKRLDELSAFVKEVEHPREQTLGPFTFRYEHAPKWDIVAPLIVSGPPGAATAKLNDALKALRNGCDEPETNASMSYESVSEIVFADATFVTVKTDSDVYCGGAYPSATLTYTTYLVATGEPVERDAAVEPSLDGQFIVELTKSVAPKSVPSDTSCYPGDADVAAPAVVKDGFHLQLAYPHAMQSCDIDIDVPARMLWPFFKKSGPYGKFAK